MEPPSKEGFSPADSLLLSDGTSTFPEQPFHRSVVTQSRANVMTSSKVGGVRKEDLGCMSLYLVLILEMCPSCNTVEPHIGGASLAARG